MKNPRASSATAAFEQALATAGRVHYQLRLYVSGLSPRSTRAVASLKGICEEYLRGRYDLEVIDIYQQRLLAEREQIIAVPTLLRKLPQPSRRIVGDLSDRERVLSGLDLGTNK